MSEHENSSIGQPRPDEQQVQTPASPVPERAALWQVALLACLVLGVCGLTWVGIVHLRKGNAAPPNAKVRPAPVQQEWDEFTDPKKVVSVRFPNPHVEPLKEFQSPDGVEVANISMATWRCVEGRFRYVLSVFYITNDILEERFTLDEAMKGAEINSPNFGLSERRSVTLGEQPAKQIVATERISDQNCIVTVARSKGVCATLMVTGPLGTTPENDNVKQFLASFRFLQPTPR